jgi:hypothetical protein
MCDPGHFGGRILGEKSINLAGPPGEGVTSMGLDPKPQAKKWFILITICLLIFT